MPRRNQPYIPLYVMDFLSDEKLRECSAESVGVYIMLMCVLHKQDEYGTILLKQKDKQNESTTLNFAIKLAKHLPYSTDVIDRALQELIREQVLCLRDDKLIQKRMVRDAELSQKRAEAGKKGGTAKSKNANSFANGFANNFAKAKNVANSENEYEIENEYENDNSIKSNSKKEEKEDNAERFALFWKAYPRKVAKANAEKAWNKLKADTELFGEIMSALEIQKRSSQWNKDDGQFIPHASTWLNQRRWEDDTGGVNNAGNGEYYGQQYQEQVPQRGGAIDGFKPAQ